jgi:hypothetical protein
VNVRIIPPPGPVEPGTSATVVVLVRNDSAIVDTFRLEVLGADHWISAEPAELSLFPNEEGTSTLAVRPPQSPVVAAGTHRVGVRVVSATTGAAVVEETDVVVSPYDAVSLTMRPATARARRRARFTATVTNRGNTGRRFWFDADDVDDLLRFRVRPTHAHLEPGESRVVGITATFFTHANPGDRVAVNVTAGNDNTNTEAKATVAVRSAGLLKALAAIAALAIVAGIFVMSGRDGTPTSGAIVAAPTTAARPERVVVTIVDNRRDIPAETTTVPPTTTTLPVTTTTTMPAPSTTTATATTNPPAKDPQSVQPPPSVTISSTSVPPTTSTTAPSPITTIRFDTPTPIKGQRDQLLVGDEFVDRGVTLFGAPTTSTFCPTATRVALLASNQFGAPSPFLTTTTGSDLHQCNSVPVGIRFNRPVKRVKLTIWGAKTAYALTAHNVKGTVVATAKVTPTCCRTPATVEVKGSLITDVTFGLDKSITAVTQIEFEV